MTKEEKKDNLAFNFHTCLRKCMDSKGASICWLSIDLLKKRVWSNFIDRLYGKELSKDNCLEALRLTHEDRRKGFERTSDMILFEIGIEMLDVQEWEALNETCL